MEDFDGAQRTLRDAADGGRHQRLSENERKPVRPLRRRTQQHLAFGGPGIRGRARPARRKASRRRRRRRRRADQRRILRSAESRRLSRQSRDLHSQRQRHVDQPARGRHGAASGETVHFRAVQGHEKRREEFLPKGVSHRPGLSPSGADEERRQKSAEPRQSFQRHGADVLGPFRRTRRTGARARLRPGEKLRRSPVDPRAYGKRQGVRAGRRKSRRLSRRPVG